MKAEEIKNKTSEAVAYLVEALQSGQSDVLSEYLTAMARFQDQDTLWFRSGSSRTTCEPTSEHLLPGRIAPSFR